MYEVDALPEHKNWLQVLPKHEVLKQSLVFILQYIALQVTAEEHEALKSYHERHRTLSIRRSVMNSTAGLAEAPGESYRDDDEESLTSIASSGASSAATSGPLQTVYSGGTMAR